MRSIRSAHPKGSSPHDAFHAPSSRSHHQSKETDSSKTPVASSGGSRAHSPKRPPSGSPSGRRRLSPQPHRDGTVSSHPRDVNVSAVNTTPHLTAQSAGKSKQVEGLTTPATAATRSRSKSSLATTAETFSSISSREYRFIPRPRNVVVAPVLRKTQNWRTRRRPTRPRLPSGTIATRHVIVVPGRRAHTHKISWRILPKMKRNLNRNNENVRHHMILGSKPPNRSPPTETLKRSHKGFKTLVKFRSPLNKNRHFGNVNVNNYEDDMMMNVELFYEKYEIQDKNTAKLEDFTRYCTLGEGAFGRVMMLENMGDRIYYAMKILKKEKVIEMGQESNCLNEKRVMQALTNPFIVNLAYHMKNNSYCFMVMEFITGGEMFDLLQDNGPLSIEDVQFYMSNVVLGFEYLQNCNIVYRDLKPENVLLAGDGYAKIADFGLSKRIDGMTYTLCGTLEYIAPEVIAGNGYYKNFDWWTVGVLTYELASGAPPFGGADEVEMFALIQAFDYEMPDWFPDELADLIDSFLQPDSNRLGSLAGEAEDIKNHPFFADVDWFATYNKAVEPPFVPEYKDPTNPRNFKKRVVEEPIRVSAHELYPEVFFDF